MIPRVDSRIPVLPGHALLGNLLSFRRDRIAMQRSILAEVGPVARVRLGLVPGVMLTSGELAHEVLVDQSDAFVKAPGLSIFARPLLGDGLLTSEGDLHKRQRRMIAPAFIHKRVGAYSRVMSDCAEQTAGRWADGAIIDVAAEMTRLTLDVAGKTLFDADVAAEAPEIGEALVTVMQYIVSAVSSVLPLPPSVPTPKSVASRRAIRRLDATVYRMIRERRASGRRPGDLLGILLDAQDEQGGGRMLDRQVRDEAMTLLLAGHETTANALSWAFYLLGQNAEAYDKLVAEARAVVADRAVTLEDLPKLPYAMSVLKEAMRLYPPAYVIVRRAIRDVSIGGYAIGKNAIVFVNILGIHRAPDVFSEPDRFIPERFAGDAEQRLPRHAFMPFGAGPRVCIGNHFALLEGQIVLATLAARARLERAWTQPIESEPLVTLRPRDPIFMRVKRFDGAVSRAA